ncbi:MAG TPA: LamG-like jellyroll fold domain-containing protein [Gemmataceae bacterium]|nr:LamG-like jellyroll fold domain-containing protein [Gemmataceae bacterium]
MRINRNHPWLRGCKFFAVPDGSGTMKNLMGGAVGTVTNAPALTRLGGHPALDMVQGSSQYTQFGTPASYGFTGPSVTVLTRARPDTLGSTNSETAFVSAAEAASAAGYRLMVSNFGGFEVGWCFVVYGGGSFMLANDDTGSAATGRERVVAGRYDATRSLSTVFLDGRKGGIQSDGGAVWDVTPSGNIFLGKFLSPNIYADGAQAWVMIFDRALSDGEIARLSRDWEWPFVDDELGELYASDSTVTYTGESYTSDTYTVSAPVTYSTAVEALGAFGGDIIVSPAPTGPVTYRNESLTDDTYIGGVPTLVFYTNVSSGTSTFTATSPVTYETLSYSSDKFRGLLDGRIDLVGSGLYRR